MDLEQSWADQWRFARRYNFNHGSLGASPSTVMDAHEKLFREINRDREQFTREGGYARVDEARRTLCAFVGAADDNLVLTTNITESLNSVLKSLALGEGDEVLITNHIYANYPGLLEELSARQKFKIVTATIPYRIDDPDQITQIITDQVSNHTRLAIIDHITSGTAMIFPVKAIIDALAKRGVDVFVDGAHAPGQVPLALDDLGAAYYGGNNHKWLCAPLSSGFLHVRPDRQADIIPAIGSGAARAALPFKDRFAWQGVIDVSPRIMVKDTLSYMNELHPAGWAGIYERNHQLAVSVRDKLCARLHVQAPVPSDMIGAMFTLPLGQLSFSEAELAKSPMHRGYDYMVEKFGFGTIFSAFGDEYLVRVTCQLYNALSDYDVLADALEKFVKDHS